MITVGTAGASAEQLGALGAAVATNDEATVRATVAAFAAPAQAAPTVPQETEVPAQAEAQAPAE